MERICKEMGTAYWRYCPASNWRTEENYKHLRQDTKGERNIIIADKGKSNNNIKTTRDSKNRERNTSA
jgi:hypothetical protein